jgi:hypothetical protein
VVRLRAVGIGVGFSVSSSSLIMAHNLLSIVDLNLPLSGVAILLVFFFLKLRTPISSLREKLARMDWMWVSRHHAEMSTLTNFSF